MTNDIFVMIDAVAESYYGKTITGCEWVDGDKALRIHFDDVSTIDILDEGDECCEHRYMNSDDNPIDLIGGILCKIEVKDTKITEGEYGDSHEICFVEISTHNEHIVLRTHNEHNGYYGGFNLCIREVK